LLAKINTFACIYAIFILESLLTIFFCCVLESPLANDTSEFSNHFSEAFMTRRASFGPKKYLALSWALSVVSCANGYKTAEEAAKHNEFLPEVFGAGTNNGDPAVPIGWRDNGVVSSSLLIRPGPVAAVSTAPNELGVGVDVFKQGLATAGAFLAGPYGGAGAAVAGAAGTTVVNQRIGTLNESNASGNAVAQAGTRGTTGTAVDASGAKVGTLQAGSMPVLAPTVPTVAIPVSARAPGP
jgi:hypothetical protein